jgi:hypothetical protein
MSIQFDTRPKTITTIPVRTAAPQEFVDEYDFRTYTTTLIVSSMTATAIVAANSWAYVVDPLAAGNSMLRSAELYVFWAAWMLLCVGPVAALIWSQYRRVWAWFIPAVAILWPMTLLAIQVTLRVEYGTWFLDYLETHPIMWITDAAIPVALLWVHFRTRAMVRSING